MPHEFKGVMIGAGYFAQFQAEAWRRLRGVRITAVADTSPGKAAEFSARWGFPKSYLSAEEMLEKETPDFVDIVTRAETHLDIVQMVAKRKIQVICQKPMAPSLSECREMVKICKESGVRLLIHENWRWQPWYRETKQVVDSGVLGVPYHLAFRHRAGDGVGAYPYSLQTYFRGMSRLLIYETLVHHLDTARYLAGEIARIFCQTQRVNPAIKGEDSVLIQLSFINGMLGIIDANRINGRNPARMAMGSCRVEGDRGLVRITSSGRMFLSEHGKEETPLPFHPPEEGYRGDSIRSAQEHYLSCLRSGERCESEGEDYLESVAAVEACYRSASTGNVVNMSDFLPSSKH